MQRSEPLDLNNPSGAKAYLKLWIEPGQKEVNLIELGTDEDNLRLAMQLFLYCDPRIPAGGAYH